MGISDADLNWLVQAFAGLPSGPFAAAARYPGIGFQSRLLCNAATDGAGQTAGNPLADFSSAVVEVRQNAVAATVAALLNSWPSVVQSYRLCQAALTDEQTRNGELQSLLDQQTAAAAATIAQQQQTIQQQADEIDRLKRPK